MISGSNEQLQQQLEYTLLKPDCYSWSISKMQSGREDTLEDNMLSNSVLHLEKMQQKRMECVGLLLEHLALIEHQFLSGIRDSKKPGRLWVMMRGVGGVRKSMHQSRLTKGLGLGLLCWDFKGVQEEIPWEEASTLQIGLVVFPPGQYATIYFDAIQILTEQVIFPWLLFESTAWLEPSLIIILTQWIL